MKWGVRRYERWAKSYHQPSSFRSSVLAGKYAATGSQKVAKRLDKSNDRDAKKWEEYKNRNRSEANREHEKLKNIPSGDKKVRLKTENGERYRYQTTHAKNKNGTYTEYTVDIKRATAVGKKRVIELTHGGLGSRTLSQAKLSQKDYDYIENNVLKAWGYRR